MNRALAGATAVVVAPGSEIAVAIAARFAQDGADVVLVGTSSEETEPAALAVRRAGGEATNVHVDVHDWQGMEAAAETCKTLPFPVRVLANCHVSIEWASFEAADAESWERALRVNVLGPVIASRAFLPLLKLEGGSIVHLGSVDGSYGNPSVAPYSTARGALVPLTHVMAHGLAPYGIRVNCVERGGVNDSGTTGVGATMVDSYVEATPLRRRAEPAEVASVFAFLASADASFVTGVIVPVDGGRVGLTPGTTEPRERQRSAR